MDRLLLNDQELPAANGLGLTISRREDGMGQIGAATADVIAGRQPTEYTFRRRSRRKLLDEEVELWSHGGRGAIHVECFSSNVKGSWGKWMGIWKGMDMNLDGGYGEGTGPCSSVKHG